MVFITEEMIKQFQTQMEKYDEHLKKTFQNVHNGFPRENLLRFLKARDGNLSNAQKMLDDCLNWRVQNDIDDILAKPIIPTDVYRAIRDSQLVGMSGYTKEGLPVIAIGVGLSTYDKASANIRLTLAICIALCNQEIRTIHWHDMTGLKLSALNQIKLLSAISTIDDLNYPEKTETYYIVNAPYIFSSCWKNTKESSGPLRLRKRLVIKERSHHSRNATNSYCYSLEHPFHQQLYKYVKEQALVESESELVGAEKHGSVHVDFPDPDPEDVNIAQTIESDFQRMGAQNRGSHFLQELKITGD